MKVTALILFAASAAITVFIPAGAAAQTAAGDREEVLLERIRVLEDEVSKIIDELARLKAEAASRENTSGPSATADPVPAAKAPDSKAITPAQGGLPGVDLGNGVRLTPYGTVYFNAFGNTSGTNNTDVPLWATANGESNTSASLRQTRFGARVEGLRAGDSRVTAIVEADFYGGLPAVGVGENFGVVRLRVAKVRFDWERSAVTLGQDWIVFSPRNPVSIAAAAIPQFAASGNLWSRLPQIRAERKFAGGRYLVEGAVLSPTSGDFPSGPDAPFLLQPGAASKSLVPSFQGRAAFNGSNWLGTGKPGSIAVSAHFGRSKVLGKGLGSYGLSADWSFPVAKRVGIAGEFFFGENLGGLQGGIFQGYNPDHVSIAAEGEGSPKAISSVGGWTQISFTPPVLRDRLTLYGSLGIDDPDNDDLTSAALRNWRSRNLSYAFNLIFKPFPQLSLGAEFRRFETSYFLTGKRTAEHFNLGAAYNF